MTITDGRLVRGARSRGAALALAVNIASVDGLDGLSIGGLAAESGLSKSGIVALFGTKVELQLATIAAAREIFVAEVVEPTLAEPGGVARLERLVSTWLDYSRTRVFAGGCFFAAGIAEVGSKPGPVRTPSLLRPSTGTRSSPALSHVRRRRVSSEHPSTPMSSPLRSVRSSSLRTHGR